MALLRGVREVIYCSKPKVLLPFYSHLPTSCSELVVSSPPKFLRPSFSRLFHSTGSHLGRSMDHSFSKTKKLLCLTAGSCLLLGLSYRSRASCKTLKYSTQAVSGAPSLKLYQYRTCPFCCKARAYMDYAGFQYEVVEVNPLTRKEMKFSEYRKVPFVMSGDVQINDSSLVISVLQSYLVKGGTHSLMDILDMYPVMLSSDEYGKTVKERTNIYFIMRGEVGGGESLAEIREEREWRQWVDKRLVHAIPPNIYRTPREALQAFKYISEVGNFGAMERFAAKYVGAVSMYVLSKYLKRKYELKPDVRQSLYDYCNMWTKAIGKNRKFMGGGEPNLADLAVYGVLSSIEGLDTFADMVDKTSIGPWYFSVKKLVLQRQQLHSKAESSRYNEIEHTLT